MYAIVRREVLSDATFLWEVAAPDVARAAAAGHFVMLRLHEGSERIPLTVADFDRDRGTITIVVQALGKTTREMMTRYAEGDTFLDFVGPLGMPQHIERVGHVVVVGGGLGVAPLHPQVRAFKEAGNRTTGILGFRRKLHVFWEARFGRWCDRLVVCTDDGSHGRPGLVTAALQDVLEHDRPDLVIAIGPLAMMQACVETTRPFGVRTMVSLNAIMVDGTGMCGSCRVTVDGTVKFACVDGPDFDGHRVDFPELMVRQKRFAPQERAASADYAHVCRLDQQLFDEAKRNYKKIKELAPRQTPMPERDARERAGNFEEVNLGYTLEGALAEAERCIQCVKPTCIAGCPVAIDIPRFIRHVLVRDFDGALAVIHESNVFPSICGRVCPQESQCEAQCIIAKKVESVGIGRLERFVGDHAIPRPVPMREATAPRLGKVAVVGSGPAGLACAADLVRAGAAVTIYEALHVVGGVLRYGIPAFRLPREIIAREVQRLIDMGVRIETNKVVGKTFTVSQLLGAMGFDAVFLGVGAGAPTFLGLPGEQAGRVYSANEFLTRVNLMGGDRFPYLDTPVSVGTSVVVIGAGNTAMDCLRVAKRLGASTVRCVYRRSEAEAPARIEELRHAKEEGIAFLFLHAPVAIRTDAAGDVSGLQVERMELGAVDEQGRRQPLPTGERVDLACDTVIYALGTKANPIVTRSTPGLALTERGYVVTDPETQATTLPGVFAGGDIVTGAATVILAMGAGRRAASAIVTYLRDGARAWPVTADSGSRGETSAAEPMRSASAASCPKCRRPLADDESYLCCAHAVLTWRCADCHKVSEGFAFPYGLCPACGGRLAVLDPQPIEDAGALAGIRVAFEIELGGHAFYVRAARTTRDPSLAALFGHFAAMEREHMATLSQRYHVDAPTTAADEALPRAADDPLPRAADDPLPRAADDPLPRAADDPLDRAAIYAGVPNHPEDPANLFHIAMAFEQRAVRFFTERGSRCRAGTPERQLYDELAAEEREHVALLATELARYERSLPGLLGVAPR